MVERLSLHRDLLQPYGQGIPGVEVGGRLAVITAGPPGVGKTTALTQVLGDVSAWVRIDADTFKEPLIRSLLGLSAYDAQLGRILLDGRPLMPLELATLVHVESAYLADRAMEKAMAVGLNVVMEGTLNWEPLAVRYATRAARGSYSHLAVIDVRAPLPVSKERALTRWWQGRIDEGSELGGRFTPPAAIEQSYDEHGHSLATPVANLLVTASRDLRTSADLIVIGSDEPPTEQSEQTA